LMYTAGTTGTAKAVMLPERAIAHATFSMLAGWDLPSNLRYLACAPISHTAGMLTTPTLVRGGTVILQRSFDPEAWLAAVAKEQPTVSYLLPDMITGLLEAPNPSSRDLSSLHTVMYGGAPLPPAQLAEAIGRLGPVLSQFYGQAECSWLATALWRHEHD